MLVEAFTTCAGAVVLITIYFWYFQLQQEKARKATGFPPGTAN